MAEVLVRAIICSQLKIDNKLIEFTTNEYGKPLLKGNKNVHFNLSHSGQWVLCAIDNRSVGVHVELVQPMELEIAERFFSEEEYTYIINKTGCERLVSFLNFERLKKVI
ncbi:MAG: hypothetical protein Q8936_22100 [Bacillota bacterium]|nr:hypothetical protein [Bacillota bacterium]